MTTTEPAATGTGAAAGDRVVGDGLVLENLQVSFGATLALRDVDLAVPAGQVLAVLGPSGCGKSTLLRAVAGLEVLAAGRICFAGRDLAGVPTHKRGFALMFQDGQLFAHQSVGGNVGYALRLRGLGRRSVARRVAELLELVGLPGFEARRPATLSGGEQQRVALARALAAEPRLLLLDEPLSALDRSLRERLAADLRQILTGTGTTALLVTHDHDEAFTVADRMAVMRAGRVLQEGPTLQVWQRPVDAEVARFLGYSAVLDGPAARVVLAAAAGGTGDAAAPASSGAAARGSRAATGIRLAVRRAGVRLDADGRLSGVVRAVSVARDTLRLSVDTEGVGPLEAVGDLGARVAPGDHVRLRVEPWALALLP